MSEYFEKRMVSLKRKEERLRESDGRNNKKKRLAALEEKYGEERKRAKTDRIFLANEILGYDFSPETHQELFDQYPPFVAGQPWQFVERDVLVLWARGHFKTTAVMVVLVIQAILVFPDIPILIMQGNIKNTQERLKEIASHFLGTAKGSLLYEIFPEFCHPPRNGPNVPGKPKDLQLTKNSFVTPARERLQIPQATVTVASPKTIKTGQHFKLGIFDDLVNDQNYRSHAQLKKVREDFDMCFPLIDPGCPRFVSGTRYAFGDLYDVIVERTKRVAGPAHADWRVSITTAWKDDDEMAGVPRFPQYIGKDGNPHGFTPEILWQVKRDSPGIYASQYLNKPMLESQQILTEEDMDAATILPHQLPPLSSSVLFIDLAAEGDTEPDDSVIIEGKTDAQGVMYAVGGEGDRWNIPQLGAAVIKYALKVRPAKILIEETASAKYFVEYLRMAVRDLGLNLPLDYIKMDNRKDAKATRIKTYAGHVKGGRLKFVVGLSYWSKLVKQSVQFQPNMKHAHDDYPDTMALMCSVYAVRYLNIAPKQILAGPHDVYDVNEAGVIKRQKDMIQVFNQEPMLPVRPQPEEIVTDRQSMGSDFSC